MKSLVGDSYNTTLVGLQGSCSQTSCCCLCAAPISHLGRAHSIVLILYIYIYIYIYKFVAQCYSYPAQCKRTPLGCPEAEAPAMAVELVPYCAVGVAYIAVSVLHPFLTHHLSHLGGSRFCTYARVCIWLDMTLHVVVFYSCTLGSKQLNKDLVPKPVL